MHVTDHPAAGTPRHEAFNAYALWERLGITEHLGGVAATRRLLRACQIGAGQQVLEMGCGTGYTACLLARQYHARVTATDISAGVLLWAARRVRRAGVGDRVTLQVADAQSLPLPEATFDAAIAESVLVFCDADRAAAQVHRVLKPGGVFGFNELTFLTPAPAELRELLATIFGSAIRPRLASEWAEVLRGAGFTVTSADTYRVSLLEQAYSHMRIDGPRRYAEALWWGLTDPEIRSTFLTREMLRVWRQFLPYVGYGLYVGKKADSNSSFASTRPVTSSKRASPPTSRTNTPVNH